MCVLFLYFLIRSAYHSTWRIRVWKCQQNGHIAVDHLLLVSTCYLYTIFSFKSKTLWKFSGWVNKSPNDARGHNVHFN